MGEPSGRHSSNFEGANRRRPPGFLDLAFWKELGVYAVLVTLYVILVLRALDVPLARLFLRDRAVYAAAAILLILLQGVGLEWLTTALLRLFRRRR